MVNRRTSNNLHTVCSYKVCIRKAKLAEQTIGMIEVIVKVKVIICIKKEILLII